MNTLKFGNGEWYGKKDTILAYNDENSNFKPLAFNFERDTLATRVNKQGLIETVGSGEPRIDYKDDSKGALLLEPSRSNSLLQSNQFDTTWAISSGSITGGEYGYDGSNNAWLLDSSAFLFQNINVSGTFCVSIYAKKGTANELRLRVRQTSDANAFFDLENGVVLSSYGDIDASIEKISVDGWYRCQINFVASGTNNVRIYSNDGDSIYIQNAQLEQGSYATSYIPTQGSAVTRVADVCNNSNVSVLDLSNSYTLFLDIPYLTNTYNNVFCEIKLSNNVESFSIRNFNKSLRFYNNLDASYPTSQVSSSTKKWVIRIDGTSFKLFGAESSLGGTLSTERSIGKVNFVGQHIPIELKDFKIYNTALSDAECEALVN